MKYSARFLVLLLASDGASRSVYNPKPFAPALQARQTGVSSTSALQVDLGYSVYQGVSNDTLGQNIFKGIRFADPPIGQYRWQPPQPPSSNRSTIIDASQYAPTCIQNGDSNGFNITAANETGASEDCLFLNIWSPANATGPLPVLVWIHGGGYGGGSGRQDLSTIINTNNNSFVGVTIQYRLGAFGFLSSDEVYRRGTPNAGLYDQHFALQWVQSYIHLFNGNATQVTISGESAGGGSVMLQDMAYGGTLGTSLFTNTISASPYLPMQYGYKDWIPSQSYYSFATAAGCPPSLPYGHNPQSIFDCLVSKDTDTLQNASATISEAGTYGTWAFLPVTDQLLVQTTPSQQLLAKKVNGLNALIGNNANEGPGFTPQNITTEDDLVSWLELTFPLFSNEDIAKILMYYSSSNASVNMMDPNYATAGNVGATAVNESSLGTGQQQRADVIYAETTFICPSYWQAEAYAPSQGKNAYKYQFSVPPALHGSDVSAYFGPVQGGSNIGPDFARAFQIIWGNFITTNNPSISSSIATGSAATNMSSSSNSSSSNSSSNSTAATSSSTTSISPGAQAIAAWPPFTIYQPYQIDLNQTGGTLTEIPFGPVNITAYGSPGLMNDFSLVNAYTWEGGRGVRCDFWRAMAAIVPE